MSHLFARIRWRLVGWTMLVVGVILVLLGGTVFFTLQRSLLDQVDRNLASSADQALPALFPPRGSDRGRIEGHEGYRGGVFFVAFGPAGQEYANPQQVNLTATAVPTPAERTAVFTTVQVNGEPVRVLVRLMPDGGKLVVGESLDPEEAALSSLLLVLLGGAGLGLLLSFGGAWFLSGRALVPIQQAFQTQQEFVADASHELRTPLTVLQSSAEILNQHRSDPLDANADLFDDMRGEISRMVRLTSDLLTLARTDRGELNLMTAPIELSDLAGDVVRKAQPLAQAKGVLLSMESAGPGPTVDADPDRIQQVLLILLDNAIKHTPAGGRVDVAVRRHGSSALLEVGDTGEGIRPEHLARIFDRFYRADAARSREQGGTGLGLAIARTLVEAHGGEISASSTPGHGTCITVRLPVEGRAPALGARLGELAAHLSHTSAHQ